jgi:hypothetical protein
VVVVSRVRLYRAVVDDDGGGLDVPVFRGLTLAGLPVGRCDCGGRVYGVEARAVAGGRRWWLTVQCPGCGRDWTTPVDQASEMSAGAPGRRRRGAAAGRGGRRRYARPEPARAA